MITYADTSVLVAWFHPADHFAKIVTPWINENVTDFVWNSVLRAEVRHNLRLLKTSYTRTAWNAFRASEKSGRLSIGRERLDHLLEAADDLSAEKASEIAAGTLDFFHVAAGLHASAECFATCDKLQADLANATKGFRVVKLFKT